MSQYLIITGFLLAGLTGCSSGSIEKVEQKTEEVFSPATVISPTEQDAIRIHNEVTDDPSWED